MRVSTPNDRTANVTFPDGTRVGVTRSGNDWDGRTIYHWQVSIPRTVDRAAYVAGASDLSTGVGMDHGPVAMLGTLLAFLEAAVESGYDGENSDLFPAPVYEWAEQWSDEIGMLRLEIEDAD